MKLNKLALVLAATLLSGASMAGTATSNFDVTATVQVSCTISVLPMAFGSITPAATGVASATTTVTSLCSNGASYNLGLSNGSGVSMADRAMAGTGGNTDQLKYNIYTDAGGTSVMGDGTSGTAKINEVGTGNSHLNQYIKGDTYKDSLTVTLSY